MGGISGIEAVVTKALVLGDSNAALLERIVVCNVTAYLRYVK